MKVTLYGNRLDVDRQGKKYRTESAWWYALKNVLNWHGHDLVKKIMSKDGHMVGDQYGPYYLRDRKDRYSFYDPNYAIRAVNEPEVVTLYVNGEVC